MNGNRLVDGYHLVSAAKEQLMAMVTSPSPSSTFSFMSVQLYPLAFANSIPEGVYRSDTCRS